MSGLKPSENDIHKVEPEIVNETSEHNSDKIISKNLIECEVLNKSTAEDIIINSDKIISKNLIECKVLNKSTAEDIIINSDKTISKNLIECEVLNKSTAEDIIINSGVFSCAFI